MSGFSLADLHHNLVRSLRGRCIQHDGGIVASNGQRHEHCGTCHARCGPESLGLAGDMEVARSWGSDSLELRWPCPGCGCEVTQETTALSSIADAANVQDDPLCHRCRRAE